MEHVRLSSLVVGVALGFAGCGSPEANSILIELSPDVISSIDGKTTVTVLAIDLDERTPVADTDVDLTVSYVDRNGTAHDIAPISGTTDARGAFTTVVSGLTWEGSGTISGAVAGAPDSAAAASFSVLDRTPPTVEILPPTTDLHVGPGLPLEVAIHVTDEIGISEVFFEARGEVDRSRSTVVASGDNDAIVTFNIDIPDNALAGPTITLYALAGDLSGNLAAAEPVVLIVDPSIALAVPAGLTGSLLASGSDQVLDNPHGLALSPKDGFLYVADNAGPAPCNGACIRKVNASDGSVVAGAVYAGVGTMEGVAFDATGDNLYATDRQNRIVRLTWDATNSRYATPVFCNDIGAGNPQDPYHLLFDATLGILTVDADRQRVARSATCNAGAQPTGLTGGVFDEPRGIAADPDGGLYVSDQASERVYFVDSQTGDVTQFQGGFDNPWGLDWIAGGSSAYADSLVVADSAQRVVYSTQGQGSRPVAYLRNEPVDLAVAGATMYILTRNSAGDRGRIFAVVGF